MLFVYDLAESLGFSLVLIIFMLFAIMKAETKVTWLIYFTGAIIQLISLCGYQKIAKINGVDPTLNWVVYIVILYVSFEIILKMKEKHICSIEKDMHDKDTVKENNENEN